MSDIPIVEKTKTVETVLLEEHTTTPALPPNTPGNPPPSPIDGSKGVVDVGPWTAFHMAQTRQGLLCFWKRKVRVVKDYVEDTMPPSGSGGSRIIIPPAGTVVE